MQREQWKLNCLHSPYGGDPDERKAVFKVDPDPAPRGGGERPASGKGAA